MAVESQVANGIVRQIYGKTNNVAAQWIFAFDTGFSTKFTEVSRVAMVIEQGVLVQVFHEWVLEVHAEIKLDCFADVVEGPRRIPDYLDIGCLDALDGLQDIVDFGHQLCTIWTVW